jgi:urea carboxylase
MHKYFVQYNPVTLCRCLRTGDFSFLEMNTRLQVEHGIAELCYLVDLVALTLQQADCEKGGKTGLPSEYMESLQKDEPNGAAIEARVYARVQFRNYAPSPCLLQAVEWPQGEGVRVDTWVKTGQRIAPYYGLFVRLTNLK